jgi:predicted MFS family arabinose efflux permease
MGLTGLMAVSGAVVAAPNFLVLMVGRALIGW